MDLLTSTIYGIIQGLTEFLPVSSSGHLALLPHFLSIKDPGVLFDLAMHVGTALSIIIYFFKDIKTLFSDALVLLKDPASYKGSSAWLANMIVATGVSFVFVLLLKGISEKYARDPFWISLNLVVFGLLMFVADIKGSNVQTDKMKTFTIKKSLLIGFSQALAIFPGVSRSGATLTMARFSHLSREEATRFSFLLSLPIILAGFFYKLPMLMQESSEFDWIACFLGMGVSFVVGLITIHFFLKFIKKMGLWFFTLYRIGLAVFVYLYLGS